MKIKKLLALVMSLVVVFLAVAPVAANAQTVCECDEIPIIYVRGKAKLVQHKDLPEDTVGGTNTELPYIESDKLLEYAKEIVPIYAKGYFEDDFEPFRKRITEIFAEVYDDYALDKNGEIDNTSGIPAHINWRNTNIYDHHKSSGQATTPEQAKNQIYQYFFQYDCRLDPRDTADELYAYIQKVKEVTGHSKIKILARCLGTNILAAYLAEYGWDDIEDVVLYNAIMNGTAITNSLFNGELFFDADAVDYFATQTLSDTTILTFIKQVITMANQTYGLDMTMDYFNMTATKVARLVVPDVMRVSYATTPGYWSMVSPDRYEAARDYIFAGVEDEWAGLIEKLDGYHYEVGVKISRMFKQMERDGVNIYNVSKYGYQLYPIMEDAGHQSDTIVTLEQQAPKTTVAPIGQTLSKEYIDVRVANRKGRYISPDKTIDASTGMFPNTTWYVKNLEHNNFPWVVDELLYTILRYDLYNNGEKMTVFSEEKFPQFLVYEGEENKGDTLKPITSNNPGYSIQQPSFFDLVKDMFVTFIQLMKELFAKISA